MKRTFENKTAVVTGAASGIGRATAIEFARRGCNLAISDVNTDGLAETAEAVAALGRRVHSTALDVADRDAFNTYAEELSAEFEEVNVIVNNAGVTCIARVDELSIEDIEWVMQINFWGVVYGTTAFMPLLERAEWGQVVNISSLFGIIAVPQQAAYHASKFAVRGFTEGLAVELEMAKSSVGATSVHPGGVKTNIVVGARFSGDEDPAKMTRRFERMATTSPESAAKSIVRAVQKRSPRLLIGNDAKAIEFMQRLAPVRYRTLVKWFS